MHSETARFFSSRGSRDDTPYASPLLLVPVTLIAMGRKNDPMLKVNDDEDPTLNSPWRRG